MDLNKSATVDTWLHHARVLSCAHSLLGGLACMGTLHVKVSCCPPSHAHTLSSLLSIFAGT